MNSKEIIGKISFSFTDENGETVSLKKTFTGDEEEIGKLIGCWMSLNIFYKQ